MPGIKNVSRFTLFLMLVLFGSYAFLGKAHGGTIQGTVRDSVSNNPIPGIFVDAFEVNFGFASTSGSSNTTDANGNYSIIVGGGTYKVFFKDTIGAAYVGQWYNGASSYSTATPVTVGGSPVAGIDAKMAKPPTADGGSINGSVTGPNGAGASNVLVSVFDYGQPVESERGLDSAVTIGPGSYVIGSIFPPGNYRIKFRDQNIGNNTMNQWWNGKDGFSKADPLPVTANSVSHANANLLTGGIITGTITGPGEIPLPAVFPIVYDQDKIVPGLIIASSNAAGAYKITRLPSGNYKVLFRALPGSHLASQWYNHQSSFSQGDLVPVTAGSTTANIDAQLLLAIYLPLILNN